MPDRETGEIAWYNPDPRAILPLDGFHRSQSLLRRIRRGGYEVTFDTRFGEVMRACADRTETWITPEFVEAYTGLHRLGHAHSIEIVEEGRLAGGAYGVTLGGAFFAESMFHQSTDASKVALHHLVERLNDKGFQILEVQFLTPHLATLGAVAIPAEDYFRRLEIALRIPVKF